MVSRKPLSQKTKANSRFAPQLLAWYGRHGRDLPWRRTRDPYRILVSEMMLQQTQVSRVLEYYHRFLEVFPDINALANAPLDRVLKAWEGLGYYARARHLHRAARLIVERYGPVVPDELEALQNLPGVGYSTAASVASLAYGRHWPVLDGNAIRVLCRVFRISGDPRTTAGKRRLVDLAKRLVPPGKIGPFNQAIMDLGSQICRPAHPRCEDCPLIGICGGHAGGDPTRYPRKREKKPRPHYDVTAGIIWESENGKKNRARHGRVKSGGSRRADHIGENVHSDDRGGRRLLIARRRMEDLLGGLWEFPGGKQENGETLEECLRREIKEELDIAIRVDTPFLRLDHGYSHFRITLHAFHCTYLEGTPRPLGCSDFRWVRISDLETFPLSRADQKLAAALRGERSPFSPA